MKKRWMLWVLISVISVTAVLSGCGRKEEVKNNSVQEETLETMEEPLQVFYDGTGEYLIKSFMSSHPEININLVEFLPQVDAEGNVEVDIQDIISKNGIPDLIIGSEEISGYLSEWYHEGYIVDIGEFCVKDSTIDEDAYFPETFEVFKYDRSIYALPLGISVDYMMMSESKYYDSAFAKLAESYTGRELLNVLMEEIQKEKEPGEFFSEFDKTLLSWMYCLDGISETTDGIQIDEELFKQVYELIYQNGLIQGEARSYWAEQGKVFNGATGYVSSCALDPRRYEGNFIVDMVPMQDAPAIILSYAETAYQYHTEEGIKAIYIPTADDGSNYKARVKIWGAVAQESKRKELAYELLRALMDEEINNFGQLRVVGTEDKNVYPINRENALTLLERFEEQTTEVLYENSIVMNRVDVSRVEKEKHEDMLNNISGLYCLTKEINKISDIASVYFDANVLNYENCYRDILNTFNTGDAEENSFVSDGENEEAKESSVVIKDEQNRTAEAKELKAKIKSVEVGETFFLGKAEQDNNLENGAEPIEWILLEKTEDKAFVISKKVIEWLTFCEFNDEVIEGGVLSGSKNCFTWKIERNQQHAWLADELYTNGFTESEKELILIKHNVTLDETILRVWELESDDYLYVPTKEEVEVYLDSQFRKAEMTAYVAEKANQEMGYIGWSLRNEGENQKDPIQNSRCLLQVTKDGEYEDVQTHVCIGVRPVMWLDIG